MRRSVSIGLQDAGYNTETAGSGEEALEKAREVQPQLVLLDIGLPGMDGMETLRALRQSFDAPVIFVTARRRELDEIVGLELGADDYVTKPFDIDVLLARVRAVLRRAAASGEPSGGADLSNLVVGDLELDRSAHQVTVGGRSGGADAQGIPTSRLSGESGGGSRPHRRHSGERLGGGLGRRNANGVCAYSLAAHERSRRTQPGRAVFTP